MCQVEDAAVQHPQLGDNQSPIKFCQNLLNILDRKHWGLLEPLINHPKTFTPLLVFLSQNGNSDPILAAFCVKCEMFETKQSSYSNFRKLLRENVKYDIVRSVVGEMMEERSQGPGDLAPLTSAAENSSILSETVKLLKDKVEDRMPKITSEEIPNEITTLKLIPKKQAVWETNFKGVKLISYQLTMSEDKMKGKE